MEQKKIEDKKPQTKIDSLLSQMVEIEKRLNIANANKMDFKVIEQLKNMMTEKRLELADAQLAEQLKNTMNNDIQETDPSMKGVPFTPAKRQDSLA